MRCGRVGKYLCAGHGERGVFAVPQFDVEGLSRADLCAFACLQIAHQTRGIAGGNVRGLDGCGVQADEQQHLLTTERVANAKRNSGMHRIGKQAAYDRHTHTVGMRQHAVFVEERLQRLRIGFAERVGAVTLGRR